MTEHSYFASPDRNLICVIRHVEGKRHLGNLLKREQFDIYDIYIVHQAYCIGKCVHIKRAELSEYHHRCRTQQCAIHILD